MRLTKQPYLQLPRTDGMSVLWETDEAGDTLLRVWDCFAPAIPDTHVCEYRPVGQARVFRGESGMEHRVAADGLKPGAEYCYQAVSEGASGRVESQIMPLRTAPEAGTAFRVGFLAETGGAAQPENVPALVRELTLTRPDLVIFLGDAVCDGGRERDWDDCFFTPLGGLFATTPFYHVMGNHDAKGAGRDIASRLFAAPPVTSFVYGDARFVLLDATRFARRVPFDETSTEMRPFDSFNERDPQWAFLERELARDDTAWKFVCLHYPPYASALFETPGIRRLCPVFERHGVDAVFASHTLHYERSHPLRGGRPAPDGTVYFIVGGVGDYPQWVRHKTLAVTARIEPKPHFVTMEVTPFRLDVKAFDSSGALFDCWSKCSCYMEKHTTNQI